ncbi:MAG: N-acetylmuramoyl-L-alanine amidase [Deltaproteobacteria bacterium]|nr:MAG: N-acetylmuramoyl-L-alanine amidase [Deltaproteobacteria bacterium]
MMRSRTAYITLFLFLILVTLGLRWASEVSCKVASKPETLIKKADQCRNSLYRSSKRMKYRHNWLNCIRQYENVYKKYPKSEQAVWAMYRSAEMYKKLYRYSGLEADLDKTLEIYKKVAIDYKDHRLADDAQYKRGEIIYNFKKDPMQAYVEFLKVEVRFPNGDARVRASKMMDKLELALGKRRLVKEGRAKKRKLILVKDIRHWSTLTYTRVVIDLESPAKYKKHLLRKDPGLRKPRRLFVDLQDTWISKDIESPISIKDGLLRRARVAQYNKNTVRVVLDIDNMEGYKIFHLYDPYRIVVDVQGKDRRLEPRKEVVAKRPPKRKEIKKDKQKGISLAKQLGLGVKRIIIDPGHGGRDPGAIGRDGLKEKDVMLKLANFVAEKVRRELKCQAILTRASDIFLPLEKRTAIANINKADLFISLHLNAHNYRKVQGVETYFLNIALDEDAMNLAARENATSRKNISDLQMILNDLMLNTKINESSRLAGFVQKGLVKEVRKRYKKITSRGVRQAPFYVLIGAEMPAILVEVGYITNATENRRLKGEAYLKMAASGIVKGIDSYIKDMELAYKGG